MSHAAIIPAGYAFLQLACHTHVEEATRSPVHYSGVKA